MEATSLSSGSTIFTISTITNDLDPEQDLSNISNDPDKKKIHESCYNTAFQISLPFFIAGIGTIGAGLVLASVTVSPGIYYHFKICFIKNPKICSLH